MGKRFIKEGKKLPNFNQSSLELMQQAAEKGGAMITAALNVVFQEGNFDEAMQIIGNRSV